MELSAVVTEGLNLCGESARFGDRSFRKLVLGAFDVLLKKKDEDALIGENFALICICLSNKEKLYTFTSDLYS